MDYPISIEVEPGHSDSLRYQITYFSDVMPAQQAGILLRQFDAVVQDLANHPDGDGAGLITSFPIRSNGQKLEIVQGLNINDFSRSKIDATINELKEEREMVSSLLQG